MDKSSITHKNQYLHSEFASILLGLVSLGLLILLISLGFDWPVLKIIRALLGFVFVLWVPGYLLLKILLPRYDDLADGLRFSLSVGISIALVPPVIYVLNYLPWGISPETILVAQFTLLLVLFPLALFRSWQVPHQVRASLDLRIEFRLWWNSLNRIAHVMYSSLVIVLLLASVFAGVLLFSPNPANYYTEFYMLGKDSMAEYYPRETAAGQPFTLMVGITNMEGSKASYLIQVETGGQSLVQVGPVVLEDGENWEETLAFVMPQSGDDQQVDLFLEQLEKPTHYRSLRLWVNVSPPLSP